MARKTPSVDMALDNLSLAEKEHREFQLRLQSAKAKFAKMVEENDNLDFSPEEALETYEGLAGKELKLQRAIERLQEKVRQTSDNVARRQRDVIEAHWYSEQAAVESRRSALDEHREKVLKAKRAIEELEGVPYVPEPLRPSDNSRDASHPGVRPTTRGHRLHADFISAQVRAATIRFYLDHGELPAVAIVKGDEVRVAKGTPVSFRSRWIERHEKPECIYGEQSGTGAERSVKERLRGVARVGVPEGRTFAKQAAPGPIPDNGPVAR